MDSKASDIFTVLWLVVWSCIVLLFDGMIAYNLVSQWKALRYPSTPALVVKSKLIPARNTDDRDTADIEYKFAVNGQTITGKKVRFGSPTKGLWSADAWEIVDRYPVGSEPRAYFSPADPNETALQVGFEPMDFWIPIFLMPFNAVMLCGWWGLAGEWFRRLLGLQPANFSERHDGLQQQFMLFEWDPVTCAIAGMGAAGFVMCFATVLGMIFLSPWTLVGLGWIAVFAGGFWWWLTCKPSIISIDQATGMLTADVKGKATQAFKIRDIRKIKVSRPATYKKAPKVVIRSEGTKARIPCGSIRAAKWLKRRLKEELPHAVFINHREHRGTQRIQQA